MSIFAFGGHKKTGRCFRPVFLCYSAGSSVVDSSVLSVVEDSSVLSDVSSVVVASSVPSEVSSVVVASSAVSAAVSSDEVVVAA